MNKIMLTAIKIILVPVTLGALAAAIWAGCYAMANLLGLVGFVDGPITEDHIVIGGLSLILAGLAVSFCGVIYCGISEIVDEFISEGK